MANKIVRCELKVKNDTWVLDLNAAGIVDLRYWTTNKKNEKVLSRTQLKASNMEAALQYLFQYYNGAIEPIDPKDVTDCKEIA
ncbi:hypothetical protein DRJ25_03960 [Candidatus Woesearchaeota archaeon]|nr:MAG: hypothetical protein DRJ25_03960 [Candidatus Woesearchaeota archaeon]